VIEVEPVIWDGRPAIDVSDAMILFEGAELSICSEFIRKALEYGIDVVRDGNTVFLIARNTPREK